MCDPVSIGALALTAVTAYTASSTRKQTDNYQAAVARNNATFANFQAADAKERGDLAASNVARRSGQLQGRQAAAMAARGLDVSTGSPDAILNDTGFFGEYDQRTTRSNAAREAYGFQVRTGNFRGDAGAYAAAGDAENPLLAAGFAGGSSLLSSGSMVAPRWGGYAGRSGDAAGVGSAMA